MRTEHPSVSVVVPVYNEQESLEALYERVRGVLDAATADWELLLVDDGSRDGSADIIRRLHEGDERVRGLLFSRNFGQDAALTAGLYAASGDVVVLMDADLQDPPELIPRFIEKWREGYDVVAARRSRREGEGFLKKLTAKIFYRVMQRLVGWEFPRDTGDFRLMDRAVVDAFAQCPQCNRFVRSLLSWMGFRATTVEYERGERRAGTTKYTLFKSLSLAVTSITSFSIVPIRLAIGFGFVIVLLSVLVMAWFVIAKFMGATVHGWASLAVSMWFLGGIQCLLLGIVGEYVGRTYVESQRRPLYIVRETVGATRSARRPGADRSA